MCETDRLESLPRTRAIPKLVLPREVFNYTRSFYGLHSAAAPGLELRRICSARATHGRKNFAVAFACNDCHPANLLYALPRAEGRCRRQRREIKSAYPRSTYIRQYLAVPDTAGHSGSKNDLSPTRMRHSWRWRESNPRPKILTRLLLHAFSLHLLSPCHAQKETAMLRPTATDFGYAPRCQASILARFATRTPSLRAAGRVQGLPKLGSHCYRCSIYFLQTF